MNYSIILWRTPSENNTQVIKTNNDRGSANEEQRTVSKNKEDDRDDVVQEVDGCFFGRIGRRSLRRHELQRTQRKSC